MHTQPEIVLLLIIFAGLTVAAGTATYTFGPIGLIVYGGILLLFGLIMLGWSMERK